VFSVDGITPEDLRTCLTPRFRLSTFQPFATPMPKNLTPAMRAHLDAETTRLAAIWRITRKDGQQFFFTDYHRDIVFGVGSTGRMPGSSARRSGAMPGFAVDNLDLVGVFAEGGIVEDEVRAGRSTGRDRDLVRQLGGSR
jgi:hypothetical protein